jgi:hypothetical protein
MEYNDYEVLSSRISKWNSSGYFPFKAEKDEKKR